MAPVKRSISDTDWTPDRVEKPKPKNSNLLLALEKKKKGKAKAEYRCETCGKRCVDRVQLKNHRKTHGS